MVNWWDDEPPVINPFAELSVRTQICFEVAGISSVEQLKTWTPDKLLQIKDFGRRSLDEVKHFLRALDSGA